MYMLYLKTKERIEISRELNKLANLIVSKIWIWKKTNHSLSLSSTLLSFFQYLCLVDSELDSGTIDSPIRSQYNNFNSKHSSPFAFVISLVYDEDVLSISGGLS